MKKLTCEMCGSTDLMKQEGVFVCQTCGCKYSVEEAKKMMVEGTVEVQGTVKVDQSGELKNLYALARRARKEGNTANAQRYYEQILVKDPDNWEPNFYTVYYQAMNCKIAGIRTEAIRLNNNAKSVLALIQKQEGINKKATVDEVGSRLISASGALFEGYLRHFMGISVDIAHNYYAECKNTCMAAVEILYDYAALVADMFGPEYERDISVPCWKAAMQWHEVLLPVLRKFKTDQETEQLRQTIRRVHLLDPTYPDPEYDAVQKKLNTDGKSSAYYQDVLKELDGFSAYSENKQNVEKCESRIKAALEAEKKAAEQRQKAKKKASKMAPVVLAVIVIAIIAVVVSQNVAKNKVANQYSAALAYMEAGSYEEAIDAFTELGDYEDSAEQLALAEKLLAESLAEQALQEQYDQATELFEAGNYEEAYAAFLELEDYQDSATMAELSLNSYQAECYEAAVALMNSGNIAEAAIAFGKIGNYEDATDYSLQLWSQIVSHKTLASDYGYVFALSSMGFVGYSGFNQYNELDIYDETDIISIAAGEYHIVGLKADGTVVSAGRNNSGQTKVSEWSNIVAIDAAYEYTLALKSDGTVLTSGKSLSGTLDVEDWTDIVAIAAGAGHAVGLKADGTVVATGGNYYGQCDVEDWTDIVAISAGYYHTVGLKADGTVVAVGKNGNGECDVSGWTNIVSVSAGRYYTVGLKADGTVVVTGNTEELYGLDLEEWTDVVHIDAGSYALLGVKNDGTLVAAGAIYYKSGSSTTTRTVAALDLGSWEDIMVP